MILTANKKKYKRYVLNLKTFLYMFFATLIIGVLIHQYLNYRLESKLTSIIEDKVFLKNSRLEGLVLSFDDIDCSGLINKECVIDNSVLSVKTEKKTFHFFKVNNIKIKDIRLGKRTSLDFSIKNLELTKEYKDKFINIRIQDKKFLENLYYDLFKMKGNIKFDINLSKTKIEGPINISLSNNSLELDLKTYLESLNKNKQVSVNLINQEDFFNNYNLIKNNSLSEVKVTTKQITILKNTELNIKNKSILDAIYGIYILNTIKEGNSKINHIFLNKDYSKRFKKEEFKKIFIEKLKEYKSRIHKEEKAFLNFIDIWMELIENKYEEVNISVKNKNNKSLEELDILFKIDSGITTRRFLDESFEFNIKKR